MYLNHNHENKESKIDHTQYNLKKPLTVRIELQRVNDQDSKN